MTKKEFAKLKVGDKVLIKKHKDDHTWIGGMDKFDGKICTIGHIVNNNPEPHLFIEGVELVLYAYGFSYKSIARKVDETEEKCAGSRPAPENRIKQLEAGIKELKEFAEKDKCYKQNKKTGEAINDVIEGMMAGGLSREEAFELVKITCAKFMSKMFN